MHVFVVVLLLFSNPAHRGIHKVVLNMMLTKAMVFMFTKVLIKTFPWLA